MKKILLALLALVVTAGCAVERPVTTPSPTVTPASYVVGHQGTPVGELLANIYAEALRTRSIGATVSPLTGSNGVVVLQIEDGSVGIVPVFVGQFMLNLNPNTEASGGDAFLSELRGALQHKGTVSPVSAVQDDLVYCVTKSTAATGVAGISDISKIANPVLVNAAEAETAPDGLMALKTAYHLSFTSIQTVESAKDRANALRSGAASVAQFRRTDPQTAEFTVLTDSFGVGVSAQQAALLSLAVAADKTASDVIAAVQEQLTQADVVVLRQEMLDGTDPAVVAAGWVAKHLG